jgi:hypothetical protein
MDPEAVSPAEDLAGDDGVINVRGFDTEYDEAEAVADYIEDWPQEGVAPSEMQSLCVSSRTWSRPHLAAN